MQLLYADSGFLYYAIGACILFGIMAYNARNNGKQIKP
jgi:hypothetical protein